MALQVAGYDRLYVAGFDLPRVPIPIMYIGCVVRPEECLNMNTELQVAQDISAEIDAAEVESAAQLVYDRAGGKPVARISGYSAHSWAAGQWLTISFDWHENTATRKACYSAEFDRKAAGEQWILSEIGVTGEQVRAGQDQPIHFNGYLERETLEHVTAYAAGMWARCTTHTFAIDGVLSNRLPPIHYGADSAESGDADFVYQVSIRDLAPRRLPLPAADHGALTVGSISSSDNTYSMRMVDVGNGHLMTTQADCVGENCDPELLARLRANLDRPIDPTELEKRVQDARAVLPARLRGARIRSTQTLMLGTTEELFVTFVETPVSETRKEAVSVICSRQTGTRDVWHCRYSLDNVTQRIPGQTREIHLSGAAFGESELNGLVIELRRQLAAHPDIDASVGSIELFSIHPSDHGFGCYFLRGRELWKAAFSYEDEVRLEALELCQRLPDDPRAADS